MGTVLMYHNVSYTPETTRTHTAFGVRGLLYPSIHLASWMDTNDQRGFCMDFLHCLEGGGGIASFTSACFHEA